MAQVSECSSCSGSAQHSSNLTNGYDVPWTVFLHDDYVCVHLSNGTQTNVSVNLWAEDTAGNGALSDQSYWVQVAPNTEKYVCFTQFGMQADQTTPIGECIMHSVVHNDDSESTGVEIWHEIY